MRMPEAGPLGETFFEASERAMVAALLLKRPSSGWVESVVTFADHFFFAAFVVDFFVAIGASSGDWILRVGWMRGGRVERIFAATFEEEIGEEGAALFGEEVGSDFDFVVELGVVHDGEDGAAGSGFGVGGGVD